MNLDSRIREYLSKNEYIRTGEGISYADFKLEVGPSRDILMEFTKLDTDDRIQVIKYIDKDYPRLGSDFVNFTNEELYLFDRCNIELGKKQTNYTKQHITDWYPEV